MAVSDRAPNREQLALRPSIALEGAAGVVRKGVDARARTRPRGEHVTLPRGPYRGPLECRGREESPALQRHEPSSARTRREDGIVRAELLGGFQDEERVFFRWELFRIGRLPPFSQNPPTSCQSKGSTPVLIDLAPNSRMGACSKTSGAMAGQSRAPSASYAPLSRRAAAPSTAAGGIVARCCERFLSRRS